jgi:hypothetical protein
VEALLLFRGSALKAKASIFLSSLAGADYGSIFIAHCIWKAGYHNPGKAGADEDEDAPEDLALCVGRCVDGRRELGEAEEEREKRGVEGEVVDDAAREAGGKKEEKREEILCRKINRRCGQLDTSAS